MFLLRPIAPRTTQKRIPRAIIVTAIFLAIACAGMFLGWRRREHKHRAPNATICNTDYQ